MNKSVDTTTLEQAVSKPFPCSNFTGKERDAETGYGYFGARYMDHELMTMWLSVDPMSDKYPSISPYAYCAWNPVKLVDPDGEDIYIGTYSDNKARKYCPNSKVNQGSCVANMLDKIYNGARAGRFVIDKLLESDHRYYISTTKDPNGNGNPDYSTGDGKHRQIYLNVNSHGKNEYTLSHELFHAFQHENNQWGRTRSCEVEAFVFAGIVMSQMNGGTLNERKMSLGMGLAYSTMNSTSSKCVNYAKAMHSLTKEFSISQMATAVSHFRHFSLEGEKYGNQTGYRYSLEGDIYHPRGSLLNKYKTEIY